MDGLIPVARSNVALAFNPVSGPSLYGFSYTVPSPHAEATFVMSGVPEVQFRDGGQYDVISPGDVSPEGMRQKAEHVLRVLTTNLDALQVGLADVTRVEIYTVQEIRPLLTALILPTLQEASRHGICWHYAHPPVVEFACEIDIRGVRQELVLGEGELQTE